MIKIRQSYHGIGGKDGYRFKVYNEQGKKLGELSDLPSKVNIGTILQIDGQLYSITSIYESDNPREEISEVVYFELEPFVYEPDYNLGSMITTAQAKEKMEKSLKQKKKKR